jgi:hypothetical protein
LFICITYGEISCAELHIHLFRVRKGMERKRLGNNIGMSANRFGLSAINPLKKPPQNANVHQPYIFHFLSPPPVQVT